MFSDITIWAGIIGILAGIIGIITNILNIRDRIAGLIKSTFPEQGICGLTQQVQKAILDQIPNINDCEAVTTQHLAEIKDLDLSGLSIASLRADDFAGLISLEKLDLSRNKLRVLPSEMFDTLSSLRVLDLSRNKLSGLPENVFANLSSLRVLDLSRNKLGGLPENVFANLSSLRVLNLNSNELGGLPSEVFDTLSSLRVLNLSRNKLRGLPTEVFGELSSLRELYLSRNKLKGLPPEVFGELSSLMKLNLSSNQFNELPERVFANLSPLKELDLSDNKLSGLPSRVFDNLQKLEMLWLWGNQLTQLRSGVFDTLSSLMYLNLLGNQLSRLRSGVFDTLSSLEELTLSDNELRELPPGVFQNLSPLMTLNLENNKLSKLASGTFDNLKKLVRLDLSNNQLKELPERVFLGLSLRTLVLKENPGVPFTLRFNPRQIGATFHFVIEVAQGTPAELTVTAKIIDGTLKGDSIIMVTVPAGRMYSDLITIKPTSEAAQVSLSEPPLLPSYSLGTGFDGLRIKVGDTLTFSQGKKGICNRTEQVRMAILERFPNIKDCKDVTTQHLAQIGDLDLSRSSIASLQVDDFAGLTSLTKLNLSDNQLRVLPPGIFSGLSLKELLLDGNPGAPFMLTLNPRQEEGAFEFVIVVAQGAPTNLTVTAEIIGGTLKGASTITVTIPAGSITSDPITITPTSETEAVLVILSDPSLLSRYTFSTGFDIEAGDPVTLSR